MFQVKVEKTKEAASRVLAEAEKKNALQLAKKVTKVVREARKVLWFEKFHDDSLNGKWWCGSSRDRR